MQAQQKTSLDEIRGTVDEKLSKTLEDNLSRSFQRVSKQLEDVYKGLGEMQSLASGVGDLKKVLSNVKTRGILGEIQLGAILQEILSPEQYETEIPTIPGSREHVEFAIRLPGDGERCVYLPIDSKFPGDTFAALQDAYETGSRERIDAAKKQLEQVIRGCAKDIRDKYIEPPYTTNFAILFLPFEGLYAEVVNSADLVERLQREYHINVAGPSTMAAILNALQMGFQTLAIQKRSDEVWRILGAVKTEFDKFSEVLQKAQKSLQGAEKHLDTLIGTRSSAIQRKLRDVERWEETQATQLLGLSGETRGLCISAMRIISISFVFAGANIAFQGIFQALDGGLESLIVSLCRQAIFVFPFALAFAALAKANADVCWTVWLTFPIAEILSAVPVPQAKSSTQGSSRLHAVIRRITAFPVWRSRSTGCTRSRGVCSWQWCLPKPAWRNQSPAQESGIPSFRRC